MLQIGSLVDGKYKILNEIGHGGMSVVYMAINEKANKTWAVKEVRKNGVIDYEAVRQGLIVETNMLKRLKHKNLPSIIDVIENEDAFLIVMDYIEGKSLANILAEEGAQPQEFVIEWAKQLCDTLEYLHTRTPAIIYRDLKPANIMVKPDGNITLIDFGTAREYKEKNIADTTCLGTVGYAAPEQFGGMGQTDARTDIYCLGATLYHLVTGNNPSDPPYEIKKIREINPALSTGLEKIIEKCTQRNPDDRFQSCAELAYALDNYEKEDDEYKSKQTQKFAAFLAMLFATIVFAVCGIVAQRSAIKMADDEYGNLLDNEVPLAQTYEEKIELYQKAIRVVNKAGEERAYLELMDLMDDDGVFDAFEEEILTKLVIGNENELAKDPIQYADVCYQAGRLFWFFRDEGDNADPETARMIRSIMWFRKVVDKAPQEFKNLKTARVFLSIGEFFKDLPSDYAVAGDEGKYADFFAGLEILMNEVLDDPNEQKLVKIELLNIACFSMDEYATLFKVEKVTMEQQLALYEKIEKNLDEIESSAAVVEAKKKKIKERLPHTYNEIITAYGTNKEN